MDTGCVGRVGPIKDSLTYRPGSQGWAPRVLPLYFYFCLYVVRYFSLYCISFRVFTFFYESIYLGGGFKDSFFSSLSASML